MEARLERKHYVMFARPPTGLWFPGLIEWDRRHAEVIAGRDPIQVQVPPGVFAFKFLDRIEGTVMVDGQEVYVFSRDFNLSPNFFYGGKIYSRAEAEAQFPNDEFLMTAMRAGGWIFMVKCRDRCWQPFREGDEVIEERSA